MMPLLLSLCGTAALVTPIDPAPQDTKPPIDGNTLVQMEVFADRQAIRPGERFTLGVRMKIEPEWHIYWENPGDSGLSTRVEVRAPAGFQVSRPRYPAPQRFEQSGDIVTFVHHGEAVLLVDVVAPDTLAPSAPTRFEVEGRWLACIEVCVPGSQTTELVLPAAARGSAVQNANEKLFVQWRAQMPQPWTELKLATTRWSTNEGRQVLEVAVPGSTALEFFPLASDVVRLERQRVERDGSASRLVLEFTLHPTEDGAPIPDGLQVDGVVRVRSADGDKVFELVVPLPKSAQAVPKSQ